jgi:hypothetical protein
MEITFQVTVPDAGHGATGFNIFPAGFSSFAVQIYISKGRILGDRLSFYINWWKSVTILTTTV